MNVPKLRFKEFQGYWESKILGDVATISSGGTPSRDNPFYWNGNIPWITTSLINFNNINNSNEFLTDEGLKNSSAKIFPKDTILMAMYGQGITRGKVSILNIDAATNQACAAIMLHGASNKDFIFFDLQKKYDYIRDLSNEGGQKNLSAGIIKNIQITKPSLKEQTKIASFLSSVDEKIAQLSRKHELLQQYKQGMMQQLFSQKLRFKDDKGEDFPEWEKLNASEIFENYSNKNHDRNLTILAATQDKGIIPREQIEIDIKTSDASIKSYKKIEIGNFVISLRSFQGGIEYSNYSGICSPAYTVLKSIKPINDEFYKNYLKTHDFIQKLNATVIGIRDGKQISYQAFSDLILDYPPSLKEQAKIANFLTAIDNKIEAVAKQLEQARVWKQGLLQQMFV